MWPMRCCSFLFVLTLFLSSMTTSLQAIIKTESLNQLLMIQNCSDITSFFPKTAEQIDCNFQSVKSNVTARIQQIICIALKDRTFENTVLEYDRTMAYFRAHGHVIEIMKMVHPDKDIRKKSEEILISWTNTQIDLFDTNKEIYRSFKEYEFSNKEVLNKEREYYFSNMMTTFQREGLELGSQEFQTLQNLQKQIALLSIQFQTNIDQDASTICLKKEDLIGIDNDFINSLTRKDKEYVLVCDYPTYFQVMTNCSIESTRRAYFHLFNNRAFPQNLDVLSQLINSRDDLAQLLGYKSYAEFDIAPQMAKTFDCVENFLNESSLEACGKIKSSWDKIIDKLSQDVKLSGDGKINAWDAAYLSNQYIKKYLNIDQEQIAEYFPMEATIQGLLHIYELFFNLKFRVVNTDDYWDPFVQMIEVRDCGANQSIIGYVLLDLFPRANKFPHCCCKCVIPPMSFDQGKTFAPAVTVVIANFSKSTASKPSLLRHQEVKTFFHEFGHAIHALFGRSEMPTKAAYNTKIDFIETPSQLLEEWMWDRDVLKKIGHHYQTGVSLPDSIIDQLLETRSINDAAHIATGGNSDHTGTELLFAKLSLNLFKAGKSKDLIQIDKDVYYGTPQIVAYDPQTHYLCTFGHLTSYGAKYYSYPWSKQLAVKIFKYIKSNGGILDPIMGQRYISKIIGRGGSCDPNILITDFLQTEASPLCNESL